MLKVFKNPGQTDLLTDIATWQASQSIADFSLYIENITFLPYFQGNVTAIVSYREAESIDRSGFVIHEVHPESVTSERSVFSAMCGGTDGG